MRKLIFFLLYSLNSFADIDIIITPEGEPAQVYKAIGGEKIYIGREVCAISTRAGNFIGAKKEPGESASINCPHYMAMSKSCRTPWGSDKGRSWIEGYNSDDNASLVVIDNKIHEIKFECRVSN